MANRKLRPGLLATTCALLLACLAGGPLPAALGEDAAKEGPITKFVRGTNADAWGKGETRPVEVGGDPEGVRIRWPVEPIKKPSLSEHKIYTRLTFNLVGIASLPNNGDVGDDSLFPEYYPSYKRGWNVSQGGGLQAGFDAGIVGFFLEVSYQVFRSEGRTPVSSGGWFEYSDIRILTFTPGFKIQIQDWMRYLYAGDATWETGWYDYLLHSFPYLKFGVGPVVADQLEVSSNTTSEKNYLDRGLSYTFFASLGLEWRPFGRHLSAFIDVGIQVFVFTTETAYSKSPDWLTVVPFRCGLSANF